MQNLKAEMARRNLTSEKLAQLIGMRPNTLRQKIRGNTEFTIPEAQAIKKVFTGLTIDYLFEKGEQSDAKVTQ